MPNVVDEPDAVPPVLVALLANDTMVSDKLFVLTLARFFDRGWLRIDESKSAHQMALVVGPPELGATVLEHERVAWDRVVQRAGDMPDVPLSALTDNKGTDRRLWWRRFEKAVLADARNSGLVRRTIGIRGFCAVLAVCTVIGGLLPLSTSAPIGLCVIVAISIGLGVGLPIAVNLSIERPTFAGREALRRHPEARAEPYSADTLLVWSLAMDQVWSSYGGTWHPVRVPGSEDRKRLKQERAAGRSELTGQVVKRWAASHQAGGHGGERVDHYFCLDHGDSDTGWTFLVSQYTHDELVAGEVVTVELEPFRVRRAEPTASDNPAR